MNTLPRNVWVLTLAQALMVSVSSLVVFVGGLIGSTLAPFPKLATLPSACIIVGTATFVVPVTFLMKKIGRKNAFLLLTTLSILISLLASLSLTLQSFYGFCFCTFLHGISVACVMQFRFAAMESVTPEQIPNAASSVLLGGIVAAFLGPEIALLGKNILFMEFAGSFVLMAGLLLIATFVLLNYKTPVVTSTEHNEEARPLSAISNQLKFWVAILSAAIGYAVMSLIMTATPVSMHIMDRHSLEDTKWVIQSHIVAMFLPSLFTGRIINKLGTSRMMLLGLLAFLCCIFIAYSGHHFFQYWSSLLLLGVGWNFLFVSGTALLAQTYRPAERFKVQAFNDFIVLACQATAALSAGWIVFTLNWEWTLLLTLPLILCQFIMIMRWKTQQIKKVSY